MIKSFTLTSHKNYRGLVNLVALVGSLLLFGGITKAATTNSGPIGIQISPVIIEVNVNPGQDYTFKLTPLNVTTGRLKLTPQVNDFKARDETGTPAVILDGSLPSSASLRSWITLSDSSAFELASRQTKAVIVTLHVPKNAEAGGHYAVVRFSGAGVGTGQQNVSLVASTGTLILVRVSGQIKEELKTISFFTSRNGSQSGIFEKSPIGFTERISNTGNVHVKPQGSLAITNMFGGHVASIAINQDGGNVLPSSIRRFDQSLNKSHLFGRYRATFNLAYGTKGGILTSSLTFWVIPYKLILLIIIIVIVLVGLIIWLVKRYNRKIIQKAINRRH